MCGPTINNSLLFSVHFAWSQFTTTQLCLQVFLSSNRLFIRKTDIPYFSELFCCYSLFIWHVSRVAYKLRLVKKRKVLKLYSELGLIYSSNDFTKAMKFAFTDWSLQDWWLTHWYCDWLTVDFNDRILRSLSLYGLYLGILLNGRGTILAPIHWKLRILLLTSHIISFNKRTACCTSCVFSTSTVLVEKINFHHSD